MNTSFEPTHEDTNRVEETLRIMADWFEDDAPINEPANLLSATLWRTARTRRRASWRNPERWLPMTLIAERPMTASPLRLVLILMTVALLTVALAMQALPSSARSSQGSASRSEARTPSPGRSAPPDGLPLRHATRSGAIATVAGNGIMFHSGDGRSGDRRRRRWPVHERRRRCDGSAVHP